VEWGIVRLKEVVRLLDTCGVGDCVAEGGC
jgi:hypothetical protein